ncbi:Hypothetical predicted protein [Octopus vulgaris]|uniref:Uncharacterized protein n=1 Tax=Octopus vulgaris TaxID=6645 RepID=A0AA36F4F1_OCTVU|nr:Hypothetical predicted protein [Octopus vulgaris]
MLQPNISPPIAAAAAAAAVEGCGILELYTIVQYFNVNHSLYVTGVTHLLTIVSKSVDVVYSCEDFEKKKKNDQR